MEHEGRRLTRNFVDVDIIPERRNIQWASLKDNSKQLQQVIEEEARRFLQTGRPLSQRDMNESGWTHLSVAIGRYYPGRLTRLKENLGLELSKRPDGYWLTPDGIEAIRKQAEEFVAVEGSLSTPILKEKDSRLLHMVRQYSGGLTQLHQDLGITNPRLHRQWSQEVIIDEARKFFNENGKLSHNVLDIHDQQPLSNAIRSYSGGIQQLRKDLGIVTTRKDRGFWTLEKIRDEAYKFYLQNKGLNRPLLRMSGESSLIDAIGKRYPGGMLQLRVDLGIEEDRKPPGYWTIERIEQEAQEVYFNSGKLTYYLLRTTKKGLADVVRRKYPGGINTLKEKIGVIDPNKKDQQSISPEEANEQMMKLLEE